MTDACFGDIEEKPMIPADAAAFVKEGPQTDSLAQIHLHMRSTNAGKSSILVFAHDMGGGADMYLDAQRAIWLERGDNVLILRYMRASKRYCLNCMFSDESFELEYADWAALEYLLQDCEINHIVINELVTYPALFSRLSDIRTWKQKKKARLTMLVHDYFAVSPSYNLISTQDWIYAQEGNGFHCDKYYELDGWAEQYGCPSIGVWRQRWGQFLLDCDEVRCFSEDSRRIMSDVYPALQNITVVPHVVSYISEVHKERKTTTTLNIGVLGCLTLSKGRAIVRDICKLLEHEDEEVKIVLIGYFIEEETIPVGKHFEMTGRYHVEDLPQIVLDKDIDLFLMPSICPETFSYTTEEILRMGMPIACLNLGAPVERVRNYEKGLVLSSADPQSVLLEILAFARALHIAPASEQTNHQVEALTQHTLRISGSPAHIEPQLGQEQDIRRELVKQQSERLTAREQIIRELQAQNRELQAQNRELQAELSQREAQLQKTTTQLASISQSYDIVSNSHIWRATKPLRTVLDKEKVFRSKGKEYIGLVKKAAVLMREQGINVVLQKYQQRKKRLANAYRQAETPQSYMVGNNCLVDHAGIEAEPLIPKEWIAMQRQKPLISIVIAAKRQSERAVYLQKALESLCAQRYQNLEVILVADASDMPLVQEGVRSFTERLTVRSVLLDCEMRDRWAYWSRGVAASSGDLIGFLEQEDTLTPNCLAYILEAYNESAVRDWQLYLIPDACRTEDGKTLCRDWKTGAGWQCGGIDGLLHFGVFEKARYQPDRTVFERWLLSLRREQIFLSPWIGCYGAVVEDVWGANQVRCIPFYLPQFHAIPENNKWWGENFTEWINVRKAQPLYPGHHQPRIPGELGYYDLAGEDGAELQRKQIALAKEYGLAGFCYYYYWFDNGKRLLEMPLERHLHDQSMDFPFCLCWANESWTRNWDGLQDEILVPQTYQPGWAEQFILDLLPYLKDERYIHVNGAPYLLIYHL